MAYPPRIPVWLPWDHEVIYFVTFNVVARQRVLANAPAFTAWQSAVSRLTEWMVIAGVMMPDHIHVLVAPCDRDADVGIFSGLMKRWIRQQPGTTGTGKKVASTGCCVLMNPLLQSGFTSARTPCEPVWSNAGRIGPTN